MSELGTRLPWLIAIRLLITVSIAVPYGLILVANPTLGEESNQLASKALLFLIGGVSILTILYIALLRVLEDRPLLQARIQFTGDLLLITALLYLIGDEGKEFSIVYFVVIIAASVLVNRRTGELVAIAAFLLYAVVALMPSMPWLGDLLKQISSIEPPLGPNLSDAGPTNFAEILLLYNLGAHLLGFCTVPFLTSLLVGRHSKVEKQLRADLESLAVAHRDIVQSIPSMLLTTDLQGLINSVNHTAENYLRRTEEELIGTHVTQVGLLDRDQWSGLAAEPHGVVHRLQISRIIHDEPALFGVTLTDLRDVESQRRGYILVFEDLTDQYKMQEQLRIKDRMAAIGEMAAGLAHEVGNPLAAISGSVQVLAGSSAATEQERKLLEITLKESRRLDRTVKSFLRLAGTRGMRKTSFDIAALLSQDVELLRNSDEVHGGHTIKAEFHPTSLMIEADPDQIDQVFWNLARNALQAMPDGGSLIVQGTVVTPSDGTGDLYRLRVRDQGCGMTQEEKEKMFQPFKSFFDQGSGIGMTIVYRIIEEHRGRIEVDSTPGEGTDVRVEIPLQSQDFSGEFLPLRKENSAA